MDNGEELGSRESTRSESSSGDWSDIERELEAALGERSPSGQDAGERHDDVKPGPEASSAARIAVRSRGNTGGEAGSPTDPSPSRTDSRKRLLEEGSGDASVPPTATKLGRRSGSAVEQGPSAASATAAGSANEAGRAAGGSTLRGPLEPGECEHPGYFGGLCYVCGAPDPAAEEEAGATEEGHDQGHGGGTQQYQKMSYLHPAMKISTSEVQRMQELAGRQLAARRRLILILDLDHTLLHSTAEADLRAEERERLVEMQGTETRSVERPELRMLHHLPQCQLWTKLRPGVRQFLAEISELYEMYIYTAGNRWYAYSMANLLDPDGLWFRNRIISKQDSSMPGEVGKRKHLSIVLGQESSVVILDDTLQVWKDHQANLLLTSRYCFFRTLSFQPMLYELYERGGYLHTGGDEDAACGQLAVFSRVLRMLHEECFSDVAAGEAGAGQDVRDVLRRLRRSVLHSCKLAFSHVIPQELRDPSQHPAWQLAEQLGAHVVPEVGPDCTQLISFSLKTRKALQAEKDRVPVLHPTWLEACRFNWRQEPPEKYLLSSWKGREPAPVHAETPAEAGPGSKASLVPAMSSDDAAAALAAAGQNSAAPAPPAARSSGSE